MGYSAQKLTNIARQAFSVARDIGNATDILLSRIERARDVVGDDTHVLVPDLIDKQYPMQIQTAKTTVENKGLMFVSEAVQLTNADPKYRTCFDGQVVYSNPKSGSKILKGGQVRVLYVTADVIEESQRLYDESKQRSAEQRAAILETGKTIVTEAGKTGKTIATEAGKTGKVLAAGAKDKVVTLAGEAKDTVVKIANRQGKVEKEVNNGERK
jgi:hypothetical protein